MGNCFAKKQLHQPYDYKTTKEDYLNKSILDSVDRIIYYSIISTNWLEDQDKLLISINNLKNLLVRYGKNPAHYILEQPISSILILTFLNQSFEKKMINTSSLHLIIRNLQLKEYLNGLVGKDGMLYYSDKKPFCSLHQFEDCKSIRLVPMFINDILLTLGRISNYQLANQLSQKIHNITLTVRSIPGVFMMPTQGIHLPSNNTNKTILV